MSQAQLDGEALNGLRAGFSGALHVPEDGGYEEARAIFNSMIERRPALIAQVESADDIRAALAYARENGLEVAVRGGGHSVGGACLTDGGVVIDMRKMNSVKVDPGARTATAQGGATWADFDGACQPHALATTGGRVSTTGVAGLTLGGGSGWYERKFGMACDNLLEVELVTADGSTVTASEDENPELFWALHGGGGNFGIATELTFRLHPLPDNAFGLLLWPAEAGEKVAYAYREAVEGAPGGAGRRRRLHHRPPGGVRPRAPAGQALRRGDRHLRRQGGGAARGDRAGAGARAGRRDDRRDPLRGDAVGDRRPAGFPQLVVGGVPQRPAGRGARQVRRVGG